MLSTSFKKHGGINEQVWTSIINADVVIANQFISRSTNATYQFFNGTIEVSQHFVLKQGQRWCKWTRSQSPVY